jgi:hypothetical protein
MATLSLSELVIVKCEDFNRQFVDGGGIIHTFLFLKSQQSAGQPICCDFPLRNPTCRGKLRLHQHSRLPHGRSEQKAKTHGKNSSENQMQRISKWGYVENLSEQRCKTDS